MNKFFILAVMILSLSCAAATKRDIALQVDPALAYRMSTLVSVDDVIPRRIQLNIAMKREQFRLKSLLAEPEDSPVSLLPDHVDLRSRDMPIQRQTGGTCTSFGLSASMENLLHDQTKLSEDHLWSLYRRPAMPPAILAASEHAITPLADWPRDGVPSANYLKDAHVYLKKSQYFEDDINQALISLSHNIPVYLGFVVTQSVMNCEIHNDPNSPSISAGHAVEVVGYNKSTKEFIIRNSWGVDCGEAGYQYIPFEYCSRTGMFCMMYSIEEVGKK